MSAWSVLPVRFTHQHFLKNNSLYSTNSKQLLSSPMWRKNTRVHFGSAPICAVSGQLQTPEKYTTLWGDHFLSYSFVEPLLARDDMISHEKLKEEVRSMLTGCHEVSETIEMIDAIQRLGVDYHFRTEIDEILANIMEKNKSCLNDVNHDLHTVSLKFRLFRQHRYSISCDVFNKFKDSNGKFKDAIVKDVRGMLSLYEATHLRTHSEEILDEALCFTTEHLKTMAAESDSKLSNKINNALNQPYYTGIPRLEAWKYLHCFEVNDSRDDTLLSFAKLDFNLLQKLHQKEVGELTRWYKDLYFGKKLPFARDRLVECYFWALGFYFEPEFSLARKMLTKAVVLSSIIDDIYDDYAPLQELQLFTAAIERWDLSEMKKLPEYMKDVYKVTIDVYSEIEAIMAKQGKLYRSYYAKESMKQFVRGNLAQSSWLLGDHMPTMDEYLRTVVPSTWWNHLVIAALLGMSDVVTKHTFGWLLSHPTIVTASSVMTRYADDISDLQTGETNRNVLTSIECYKNENNCTVEEAVKEFKSRIINLNKEINGEMLRLKSIPMCAITTLFNHNRLAYVVYGDVDHYTNNRGFMEDCISALLVDPIPE